MFVSICYVCLLVILCFDKIYLFMVYYFHLLYGFLAGVLLTDTPKQPTAEEETIVRIFPFCRPPMSPDRRGPPPLKLMVDGEIGRLPNQDNFFSFFLSFFFSKLWKIKECVVTIIYSSSSSMGIHQFNKNSSRTVPFCKQLSYLTNMNPTQQTILITLQVVPSFQMHSPVATLGAGPVCHGPSFTLGLKHGGRPGRPQEKFGPPARPIPIN